MTLNLEVRKGKVGASECAALVSGIGHLFRTKSDVYARVALGIEQPQNEAMRMGGLMEGSIFWLGREQYRNRGIWTRRNSTTTVRDRYVVTPDGYCGCGGVIECKNVSQYGAEHWADDVVPPWYVAQVQLQMHATGRDHAHVWALLAGVRFVDRRVDADAAMQRTIIDAIDAFYRDHVEPRIPPDDDPDWALTFAKPEGVQYAEGALKDIGEQVARSAYARALEDDANKRYRETLTSMMAERGIRELIDTDWTAKAGPSPKQPERWQLTFRRNKRG